MFLGIYDIDEYVAIPAVTHQLSSGNAYEPTDLAYSIYEEGNATGLDEAVNMTPASPFDSIVGVYYARRQLTVAAGFERGKTYMVVVSATVDGVSANDVHIFQVRAIQTAAATAAEVLVEMNATPPDVNIKKINGATLTGDGESGTPWGPV
jgi:hypothetical protein